MVDIETCDRCGYETISSELSSTALEFICASCKRIEDEIGIKLDWHAKKKDRSVVGTSEYHYHRGACEGLIVALEVIRGDTTC